MIAVLINAAGMLFGGMVGLLFRKLIPKHAGDPILKGIGLVNIYIGISGTLKGEQTLILILSIVLGALIGGALDIDHGFNHLAERLEGKFEKGDGSSLFAQAFTTTSLLMCVGSIAILGPMNVVLNGDDSLMLVKTVMDTVTAVMLAASMGVGVLFAAIPLIAVEGGVALLAEVLAPLLSDSIINEITCVGSVLIVGLALNMVCNTKLKVLNYIPAVVMPALLLPAWELACRVIAI